jgi:hypothetical protein
MIRDGADFHLPIASWTWRDVTFAGGPGHNYLHPVDLPLLRWGRTVARDTDQTGEKGLPFLKFDGVSKNYFVKSISCGHTRMPWHYLCLCKVVGNGWNGMKIVFGRRSTRTFQLKSVPGSFAE